MDTRPTPADEGRDAAIARLRHLADVVEKADHVPAITDDTPRSELSHIDGFSMSHYCRTDGRSSILDHECSTVACLGGYACSLWGHPRPWTWGSHGAMEALGLKRTIQAEVLFAPRYLEEVSGEDGPNGLAEITPAEAARACRRLANLLENEPESLEPPGYGYPPGFEKRLTEALWGEEGSAC